MSGNPIPSAMVYFDEKQRRAVLCLDKGIPPNLVESCNKNGEFHTHSWVPRGWVSEATFMGDPRRVKGVAAAFVRDLMRTVISIRDEYDRMEHELHAVRKINTSHETVIRQLVGCLKEAVPMLIHEEERLRLLRMISNAQRHQITDEEG